MNRFTLHSLFGCLLICLFPLTVWSAPPNVLWFIVDDMSPNFRCYGETKIETPHVDRLAAEGVRFTHAFVTAPVCSPCRSALITGMYQTAIGAHHHRSGRGELKIRLPDSVQPVPELFQKAGYFTCIGDGLIEETGKKAAKKSQLGKTDYNFEWDPKIYDGPDWSQRAKDQPFFMQVQLSGGKLREGAEEARGRFLARVAAELGTSTSSEVVSLPPYYPDDPILRADWAAYLDAVRMTDLHVGKVMERLSKENILDNTLVVFMTDHGISHARGKQFLYNEGTHVPLIIRGPGIKPGSVRNDLVEHIDLGAISLAAAGIPIPAAMQGRNVLAKNYEPRKYVFAARDRCDETVERIRSVRSNEYLYIRNDFPDRPHLQPNAYKDGKGILKQLRKLHADGTLPELSERLLFRPTRPIHELYRYQDDRWQITNLAENPEHSSALASLQVELNRWMESCGDRDLEPAARYDSDMAVYLGRGNPVVEENIRIMKQWAAEGK